MNGSGRARCVWLGRGAAIAGPRLSSNGERMHRQTRPQARTRADSIRTSPRSDISSIQAANLFGLVATKCPARRPSHRASLATQNRYSLGAFECTILSSGGCLRPPLPAPPTVSRRTRLAECETHESVSLYERISTSEPATCEFIHTYTVYLPTHRNS